MPTADGRVATPRASRYLVQLCRHADRMSGHQHLSGHVRHGADSPQVRHSEWTDADGVLELDRGRCTLHVTPDALLVHIDAPEDETLRRIQDLITARLEGFGRRDGLQVQWHHPPSAPPDDGAPAAPDAPVTPQVVLRAGRRHLPQVAGGHHHQLPRRRAVDGPADIGRGGGDLTAAAGAEACLHRDELLRVEQGGQPRAVDLHGRGQEQVLRQGIGGDGIRQDIADHPVQHLGLRLPQLGQGRRRGRGHGQSRHILQEAPRQGPQPRISGQGGAVQRRHAVLPRALDLFCGDDLGGGKLCGQFGLETAQPGQETQVGGQMAVPCQNREAFRPLPEQGHRIRHDGERWLEHAPDHRRIGLKAMKS